jgi:hypothetical protein
VSKPPLNPHTPQIQIQWPKLDFFTESVSTNGVAPRRPGQSAPGQIQSSRIQIRI